MTARIVREVEMGAQEKISSIISQKVNRAKFPNFRVDKTVPSGLEVGSRLCNENCVFVRNLGIACHDDISYKETGMRSAEPFYSANHLAAKLSFTALCARNLFLILCTKRST